MQCCIMCKTPTSHTVLWKELPIVAFICKKCSNTKLLDSIEARIVEVFKERYPSRSFPFSTSSEPGSETC